MAFISFMGYEPRIADGQAELTDGSVRSLEDTVAGDPVATASAIRDGLTLRLALTTPEVGAALRGLVAGRGDRWAFALSDILTADLYSGKGAYPTNSAVHGFRGSESGVDIATEAYTTPKFGTGCVEIAQATTNMLSSNVATGTDTSSATTGFTAIDSATLTSSTAQYRQGSRSLKCVTSGTVNGTRGGFQTTNVAAVAATYYVGSVYLRADSGTPSVRVALKDDVGAVVAWTTVALSATAWTRVEVQHQTDGGATAIGLHVEENTADSAISFYADQLQIEAHEYPTAWVNGTRAAGQLDYRLGELRGHDDLTVACWARAPYLDSGDTASTLFQVGSGTDYVVCYRNGSDALKVEVYASGVLQTTLTVSGILGDLGTPADWFHVAFTMRRNPSSGTAKCTLYVDGTSAATASPTLPALSGPTLYVGTDSSHDNHWNGQIDELIVTPWAWDADMVDAWHDRAFTDLPELLVSGDVLGGDSAEVRMLGEVGSDPFTQASNSGTWSRRMRSLSFTLRQAGEG